MDDETHDAARFLLEAPAWQVFRKHYIAAAQLGFLIAARAADAPGVAAATEAVRALVLIDDALAAVAADAKVRAAVADRRRRRVGEA
jgi:hypothetical protein